MGGTEVTGGGSGRAAYVHVNSRDPTTTGKAHFPSARRWIRHAWGMDDTSCGPCGGTGLTEHTEHTVETEPDGTQKPVTRTWTGACSTCSGTSVSH